MLTSTNGVDALADRLHALGRDARHLAGLRVGVVGTATRDRLAQRLAIRADVVPERQVGTALADALLEAADAPGRALLLRADIASPELPDRLRAERWEVTELAAYRTLPADALPDAVGEALQNDGVDYVTFTSSSTANNFAALLEKSGTGLPGRARLASIGPVTSSAMRSHGWRIDVEASPSDVPSLVRALVADAQRPDRDAPRGEQP